MLLANVQINSKTVLAPLAGVSDAPFRQICKEFGAGLVFTEMVSADGLVHGNQPSLDYCYFDLSERPIGIQLFGHQPETLAEAAAMVSSFKPDFIDVNMGCPVPKVVKRGAGSALLKNLPLIREIVTQMKASTTIPLLAKIRSGWSAGESIAVEVAQLLAECGCTAVTIHPRTQAEKFHGQADWQIIQAVKKAVTIPVIGNGDVLTPEDARQMLLETGCDLVMIGRGALGNPWLFRQINTYLEDGTLLPVPDYSERFAICLRHFQRALSMMGERYILTNMRKQIGWYTRGMPESTIFRQQLFQAKTRATVEALLSEYQKYLDRLKIQRDA